MTFLNSSFPLHFNINSLFNLNFPSVNSLAGKHLLEQVSVGFSYKRPEIQYFWLCKPQILCLNYSTPPLLHESNRSSQNVNQGV